MVLLFPFLMSLFRASRVRPQWPAFPTTPGGAVFRRRVPRPPAAKKDDHSAGSWLNLGEKRLWLCADIR